MIEITLVMKYWRWKLWKR